MLAGRAVTTRLFLRLLGMLVWSVLEHCTTNPTTVTSWSCHSGLVWHSCVCVFVSCLPRSALWDPRVGFVCVCVCVSEGDLAGTSLRVAVVRAVWSVHYVGWGPGTQSHPADTTVACQPPRWRSLCPYRVSPQDQTLSHSLPLCCDNIGARGDGVFQRDLL